MTLRAIANRMLPARARWPLVLAQQRIERALGNSPLARRAKPFLIRRYLECPEEVDIEVTSSCDADCIMCPRRSMRRNPGPMPMPLFQKIVDDAVSIGVRDLVLNGYGEISTLRNAGDYLRDIRERSQKIRIIVNTNGMRLDEEMASVFIEHGVDVMNIAIDGATAETYESIRKELKLDVVEANVHRLIKMRDASGKNRPFLMVHMIHMAENAHESDAFLKKWTGVADHAGIAGLVSRIGSVPVTVGGLGTAAPSFPCFLLWRQMPVLSDGTVALCCDDWDGQGALGNMNHQTISEIWQAPHRRKLRQLHLEGRQGEIDVCSGCHEPRNPPTWFWPTAT
jgi:hypothetical protein